MWWQVANSSVRANAAALLCDVFPLQSDNTSPQVADDLLQRQFDAFKVICLIICTMFQLSTLDTPTEKLV